MVLTPIMSRVRATAAVSGGVAWCASPAPGSPRSGRHDVPCSVGVGTVRAAGRQVTLLPTSATIAATHGVPAAGGLGGGPGGGSSGGFGRVCRGRGGALAGQARLEQRLELQLLRGSTGHHVASSEGPGLVAGIFKHVGHWLGLSSDDSKTSSDSKTSGDPAPKPAKPADAGSGSSSSEGGSAGPGPAGGKSADTSGASDIVHSVFAGLGRSSAACSAMRGRTVAALEGGAHRPTSGTSPTGGVDAQALDLLPGPARRSPRRATLRPAASSAAPSPATGGPQLPAPRTSDHSVASAARGRCHSADGWRSPHRRTPAC